MQSEKYIRSQLEQLNSSRLPANLYLVTRKLSANVQLAKIWSMDKKSVPVKFYLITAESKRVGAVMEHDSELYAYMLTPYRRKGLLKTALKSTVLPHLLQQTPIIRVTLNRSACSEKMYLAAKNLARETGFEILKEENGQCRLLLDGTTFQKRVFISGENIPLSDAEKATVQDFLQKAGLYVSIVQCLLEFKEGRSSISEDLLETGRQLDVLNKRIH